MITVKPRYTAPRVTAHPDLLQTPIYHKPRFIGANFFPQIELKYTYCKQAKPRFTADISFSPKRAVNRGFTV